MALENEHKRQHNREERGGGEPGGRDVDVWNG